MEAFRLLRHGRTVAASQDLRRDQESLRVPRENASRHGEGCWGGGHRGGGTGLWRFSGRGRDLLCRKQLLGFGGPYRLPAAGGPPPAGKAEQKKKTANNTFSHCFLLTPI